LFASLRNINAILRVGDAKFPGSEGVIEQGL